MKSNGLNKLKHAYINILDQTKLLILPSGIAIFAGSVI